MNTIIIIIIIREESLKIINIFLTYKIESINNLNNEEILKKRICFLNNYVFNLDKNVQLKKNLLNFGYNEEFFQDDLYFKVTIQEKKNFENNYKKSLIKCFSGYCDILKSLNILK